MLEFPQHFPFYVTSPTGKIHRAQRHRKDGSYAHLHDHFATRCGYHVGDWSRARWGELHETPAFVPPGTRESRCKRCWPEFVADG